MDECLYDEKTLTILNGEYPYRAIIKSIVQEGWKKAEKELAPIDADFFFIASEKQNM